MQPFVEAAFLLDTELLNYYDKGEKITSTQQACDNVMLKLNTNYADQNYVGVYDKGVPVGYFAYMLGVLISFGLNKNYRNSIYLKEFWKMIKGAIGTDFTCILYSYNTRGLEWLKKCGMEVQLDNVTVLHFDNN